MGVWKCKKGKPLPLGATVVTKGVNFALFSRHATSVMLVFFEKGSPETVGEIVLDPKVNKTGDIWHILVHDMDTSLRYAYRADGPFDPKGEGHWFKKDRILLDPYARALEGGEVWGELPGYGSLSKTILTGKVTAL